MATYEGPGGIDNDLANLCIAGLGLIRTFASTLASCRGPNLLLRLCMLPPEDELWLQTASLRRTQCAESTGSDGDAAIMQAFVRGWAPYVEVLWKPLPIKRQSAGQRFSEPLLVACLPDPYLRITWRQQRWCTGSPYGCSITVTGQHWHADASHRPGFALDTTETVDDTCGGAIR